MSAQGNDNQTGGERKEVEDRSSRKRKEKMN